MAHSIRGSKSRKPRATSDKLTARGDGRWCKKYRVNGKWKYAYFRGTEAEALAEWQRVKADLLAGRDPRRGGKLDMATLCSHFLAAKRAAMDAGRITAATFFGYAKTTAVVVEQFGRGREVDTLGPADFAVLHARIAARHGVATQTREIAIVRSIFKYAYETDLLERPVKFGPDFKGPAKRHRRAERNRQAREHGKRMFDAADVRRLLGAAGPQMKAMILLAANGGLGNSDCAGLHLANLDLASGWLDYPRPETQIDRRIPLWPETVAALRDVLAARREPADKAHAGLVFLTARGQPWVKFSISEAEGDDGRMQVKAEMKNAVGDELWKLLNALGIYRRGLSFYTLRHTFETVAGDAKDQVAVDAVMGHVDGTMAGEYREGVADERLKVVVNHVRAWLWPAVTEPLRVVGTTIHRHR